MDLSVDIPASPQDVLSERHASLLISHWRKKQQDAKIAKKWADAAYQKARAQAIRAKQVYSECEQSLQSLENLIDTKGYQVIWESPKDGIYTPYVLNINQETGLHTVSIDGGPLLKFYLQD